MKITTYKATCPGNKRVSPVECHPSHGCVSYASPGSSVVEVDFILEDGTSCSVAYVHMTPDEAEEMARILIVNAWRARFNK